MPCADKPSRRLTGTHITLIAVAALVTLVPGAAVAVVSATKTTIVGTKGQPAYVTNNQLNVRGVVGTANVVPTGNLLLNKGVDIGYDKQINQAVPLSADVSQDVFAIGQINIDGYTPNDPKVQIFVRYIPTGAACSTNPSPTSLGDPGYVWGAEAQRPDDSASAWTFPIPLVVQPRTGSRRCLYAWVSGYTSIMNISLVGARGTTR
jgi:hypothetical protein